MSCISLPLVQQSGKVESCKRIIWDWNGTVWDDAWLCLEISNGMLRRRGLPAVSPDDYRERFVFPVADYYRWAGFDLEKEPFPELAVEFIVEYERRRFECDLHGGAREILRLLSRRGIPQAVLSAYKHDTLLEAVEYYGLTEHFADIVGLGDVFAASKVQSGLAYVSTLDCPRDEILFLGDTLHDFEVAEAMGVRCALIAHGHNSRPRLEACGVPVFSSFAELMKHGSFAGLLA